jgi:hypothetical protein
VTAAPAYTTQEEDALMQSTPTNDYSRKWWALAAVGSGTFMSTVDGSIVNIALNTIQQTYNASFLGIFPGSPFHNFFP